MIDIESYLINQIRENLEWLVKNTDVAWFVVHDNRDQTSGIRFVDATEEIVTIWEDET